MNGVANGLYGGDLPNQINTPWIDFSEQSTIVGWGVYTNKQIRYKQIGNIVYVMVSILGTSNSGTTTFTLPILPKFGVAFSFGIHQDNGTFFISGTGLASLSGIVTCYKTVSSSNIGTQVTWTASGTKQIQGQFFYEI